MTRAISESPFRSPARCNRPDFSRSALGIALGVLLLALRSTSVHAETLWALTAVDGARWPDAASPVSVHLVVNDEVEVLVRQGPLARVRKGTDFGWVQSAALTNVEPPKPVATEGEVPGILVPDGNRGR